MRLVATLFLALTAACGGSWSPEDVAFLQALPTRSQLAVTGPGSTENSSALSDLGEREDALGQSTVLSGLRDQIRNVNTFITVFTAGLDFIRTLPPSTRATNRREWGPYPDSKPNTQLLIIIERTATNTYEYAFKKRLGTTGDFATVVSGTFIGDKATKGQGALHYDATEGRRLGNESNADLVAADLTYDLTKGSNEATFSIETVNKPQATFAYVVQPGGSGVASYVVIGRLDSSAKADESLTIDARWLATGAGRADIQATGGDLGSFVGRYAECWNPALTQVFVSRNFNCPGAAQTCTDGAAAQCAIPPAGTN